ncbi:MAG: hypothetical protein ACUVTZ_13295 [Armatimonadota bacterium]
MNTDSYSVTWQISDYHIHTFRSPCGKEENTVSAVIRRAEQIGLFAIGFSDHLHTDTDPADFARTRAEVAAAEPRISVSVGCEAELLANDGTATIEDGLASELDYVLLAPMHDYAPYIRYPTLPTAHDAARYVVERHIAAASHPLAHVVAHPFTGVSFLGYRPEEVLPLVTDADLESIVSTALSNGTAFELSRRALNLPSGFARRFYRMVCEAGADLLIGSDAHDLASLEYVGTALDIAAELGIPRSYFRSQPRVRPVASRP